MQGPTEKPLNDFNSTCYMYSVQTAVSQGRSLTVHKFLVGVTTVSSFVEDEVHSDNML